MSNHINTVSGQEKVATVDLGPLAWVVDTLRDALQQADTDLKQFCADVMAASGSHISTLDTAVLRQVSQGLHEAVGVLGMVEQPSAAKVVSAMEAAVQRFIASPELTTTSAVAVLREAGKAVIDYLSSVLRGNADFAPGLFPKYLPVVELAGLEQAHPADLWRYQWRWLDIELDKDALSSQASSGVDVLQPHFLRSALTVFKTDGKEGLLELMGVAQQVALSTEDKQARTFWLLFTALVEVLITGQLRFDAHVKRLMSRIISQFSAWQSGQDSSLISEHLALDMLYFVALGVVRLPDLQKAPVAAAVSRTYELEQVPVAGYEKPLYGVLTTEQSESVQAQLTTFKALWSDVAGGDVRKVSRLHEEVSPLLDLVYNLWPDSVVLCKAIWRVVDALQQSGIPPGADLGMEMATTILFLEASLANYQPADPCMAKHSHELADRLLLVLAGQAAPELAPWMRDLYMRVSDGDTMRQVVAESRVALGEIEQELDQFFRAPQEVSHAGNALPRLEKMGSALSMLGYDSASRAVIAMRGQVQLLITAAAHNKWKEPMAQMLVERVAGSLGTLSFLLEMLEYQPDQVKQQFYFDESRQELFHRTPERFGDSIRDSQQVTAPRRSVAAEQEVVIQPDEFSVHAENARVSSQAFSQTHSVLGQEEQQTAAIHVQAFAADGMQPLQDTESGAASHIITVDTSTDLTHTPATDVVHGAAVDVSTETTAAVVDTQDDGIVDAPIEEDDLREIFLEEAAEVIGNGQSAIDALHSNLHDHAQLTNLRRVFHTLKGSGRMVGLASFGEAAWELERTLNGWLAESAPATPALLDLARDALVALAQWRDAIAQNQQTDWHHSDFKRSALVMQSQRQYELLTQARVSQSPTLTASNENATLPVTAAVSEAISELPPVDMADLLPVEEASSGSDIGEAVLLPNIEDSTLENISAAVDVPELNLEVQSDQAKVFIEDLTADPIVADDLVFDAAMLEPVQQIASGADAVQSVNSIDLPVSDLLQPSISVNEENDRKTEVLLHPDDNVLSSSNLIEQVGTGDYSLFGDEIHALDTATHSIFGDFAEDAEMPEQSSATMAAIMVDTGVQRAVLADMAADLQDDEVKSIGDLRIPVPLFNAYLNEADGWARQLVEEIEAWRLARNRIAPELAGRLAHSLAGSSAAVGLAGTASLARGIEHAIAHLQQRQARPEEVLVIAEAASMLQCDLHQFAAGIAQPVPIGVLLRLAAVIDDALQAAPAAEGFTTVAAVPVVTESVQQQLHADSHEIAVEAVTVPQPQQPQPSQQTAADISVADVADAVQIQEAIDPDLFEIFRAEGDELLPQISAAMRQWQERIDDQAARNEILRLLHTLKGGARLAGAMRLGGMAHDIETEIGELGAHVDSSSQLESVQTHLDDMEREYARISQIDHRAPQHATAPQALVQPPAVNTPAHVAAVAMPGMATASASTVATTPHQGEKSVSAGNMVAMPVPTDLNVQKTAPHQQVRVRAQLLDRLLGQAGEVMTSRARLEGELGQLRGALKDMDSSLDRLRAQLREMELQAETQMQSRLALSKEQNQNFDPLEFDRFTRVQELTRMMAESVNDVASVQRNILRTVQSTEDDLSAQARQTKDLQDDLLRTRTIEFDSLSERLYRVVRQSAKETGKQVKLDIVGANLEMDRSIIERIAPVFEHLLRNAVVHGVEDAEQRARVGKGAVGNISISLQPEGNDVLIRLKDDGAGLNVLRIREKAIAKGLLEADGRITDEQAAQLIFSSGLSTVDAVTSLAGRGVGMDVVRNEVNALGGRIEVSSRQHMGTEFTLVLPLTTAVTQVVELRMGDYYIGVPSHLVDSVRRATAKEIQNAYNSHTFNVDGTDLPFYWGGAMLQVSRRSKETVNKRQVIMVLRSAAQRIVLHVDEVMGAHEVVVKNLGPQLSRVPALAGITILPDGRMLYIYNPVALSYVYAPLIKAFGADLADPGVLGQDGDAAAHIRASTEVKPLVLVVDDSITVRRVTERLLKREGYRVALAADGVAALRALAQERPGVVLSDIEMPQMDGFDLLRNIRLNDTWQDLPVVMITSRTADKHREHAMQLGASGFLGKPYPEDQLLELVRQYAGVPKR